MLNWLNRFGGMLVQSSLNNLWQGLVVVACLILTMKLLKRTNAASRYAALLASLAVFFLLLLAGFRQAAPEVQHAPVVQTAVLQPVAQQPLWNLPRLTLPDTAVRAIALLWTLVAGWKLVQILRSFRFLQRSKQQCAPLPDLIEARLQKLAREMGITQSVRGGVSCGTPLPVTLGLGSPVILIPEDLPDRLDAEDLDHVLLHELTHVLRRDDLTRLAQKLLEAFLFFHPAAHWIARRLDLEREVACDDSVILHTGTVRSYARCLTKLAGSSRRIHRPLLAMGLLQKESQLSRRIDMLLNNQRKISLGISKTFFLSTLVVLLFLFGLFAYATPLIAVSLREQGLQHMKLAEQDMQKAEAQMLQAAEAKKKATDEQSLAMAEMQAETGRMQMASAKRRLDLARAEIHGDANLQNTPEFTDAIQDGIAGGIEGGVEGGISSCPLAQEKFRMAQEKLKMAPEHLWMQQKVLQVEHERMVIEMQKSMSVLKGKMIHVHVPEVHVHVPAMEVHTCDQDISMPDMDVQVPEMNMDVPVLAPTTEVQPTVALPTVAPAPAAPATVAAPAVAPAPESGPHIQR